jgi:diguanylate cyclase (GGDEF)-like protein
MWYQWITVKITNCGHYPVKNMLQTHHPLQQPTPGREAGQYSGPSLPTFTAIGETSEEHGDRLFLKILLSLLAHIIALLGIFYFLLPLSEEGREFGGTLLWSALLATGSVTAIFLKFGLRTLCANLLLTILSSVLVGSSFLLGGVMSPTMIFLLAMPVMAATLMNSRWVFFWTAVAIACWLAILALESSGVEMRRITAEANIGPVQVLSLLGTSLIVMSVLGSYLGSNSRLRGNMEDKTEYLDYLANHDVLTTIPNRRAFFEQANQVLARANRSGQSFAIVVLDLNKFKEINDKMGYVVGDAVLQHFANRLKSGFRETDFFARLGGDEFAVILEPVDNFVGVKVAVERFINLSADELEIEGEVIHYTCSTGSSIFPEHGKRILDLYEEADQAMYRSKRTTPIEFAWR